MVSQSATTKYEPAVKRYINDKAADSNSRIPNRTKDVHSASSKAEVAPARNQEAPLQPAGQSAYTPSWQFKNGEIANHDQTTSTFTIDSIASHDVSPERFVEEYDLTNSLRTNSASKSRGESIEYASPNIHDGHAISIPENSENARNIEDAVP